MPSQHNTQCVAFRRAHRPLTLSLLYCTFAGEPAREYAQRPQRLARQTEAGGAAFNRDAPNRSALRCTALLFSAVALLPAARRSTPHTAHRPLLSPPQHSVYHKFLDMLTNHSERLFLQFVFRPLLSDKVLQDRLSSYHQTRVEMTNEEVNGVPEVRRPQNLVASAIFAPRRIGLTNLHSPSTTTESPLTRAPSPRLPRLHLPPEREALPSAG